MGQGHLGTEILKDPGYWHVNPYQSSMVILIGSKAAHAVYMQYFMPCFSYHALKCNKNEHSFEICHWA